MILQITILHLSRTVSSLYLQKFSYLVTLSVGHLYSFAIATQPSLKRLILGNPGIGKTFFGFLILAHLARIGATVVYESGPMNQCFLFSSNRVAIGNLADFRSYLTYDSTYYIVDANRPAFTQAKTVLLSSPRREVWYEFNKTACTLRYMPVWSYQEIDSCRNLLFPRINSDIAKDQFEKWGGIPRFVLQYAFDDREQSLLQSAISSVDLNILIHSIGNPEAPEMAAHRLVHMIVDKNFTLTSYRFASEFVIENVYQNLLSQSRQQLIQFLAASHGIDSFAVLRGTLFERHAHTVIRNGGTFRIRQLKAEKSVVLESTLTLPQLPVFVFDTDSQILTTMNSYLLPKHNNFESVDSFIKPNLLFQMTSAKKHPCKHAGLHRVLNLLGSPLNPQLYFVVPMDQFESFGFQKYEDSKGKIMNMPIYMNVKSINQFVLGIELIS
ncbi:hypothetical protein HK096_000228 [Nowakowskiella sp. JEL0078]|nr:hypothetical protein HK096_000228 [Nowakowskiella sp. JEL0078]